MNRIDPKLKKLMDWSRQAPPAPGAKPDFGFSHRVVRSWLTRQITDPFSLWQEAVWRSAWAAATVILVGIAILTAQKLSTNSPYDVSPAYEVVSTELVP